jgi:hypothetical protein
MTLTATPGSDSREDDEREEYLEGLRDGRFDLGWMRDERVVWGNRAEVRDGVGITLKATNKLEHYGRVEDVAPHRSMAPRGAVLEDDLPSMGYDYNHKYQVWADNVESLYDEAVSRQWDATRDIPWREFETLPPDLERAMTQVATLLTEVEFIATDFPAKWSWRMNQHFHEVKMFLATQAIDEARHLEVFRKRALAGGGGLLHVTPNFEWAGKLLLDTPSHTWGSFFLNLLGEGMILSVFRAGEFLARTHVDREIFRLCLQDEARHVAFGTIEMKNYLESHPEPAKAHEMLHAYADMVEPMIEAMMLEPTVLEPVAILMGGGTDDIDFGMDGVSFLWGVIREEYLERCDRAGFDRRERCTLYADLPWKVA